MVHRKFKVVGVALILLVASYLSLPFALIPIAITGSGGYASSILNIAYSPIIVKLSEQNPYRAALTSYAKGICAENPGRCKDEQQ